MLQYTHNHVNSVIKSNTYKQITYDSRTYTITYTCTIYECTTCYYNTDNADIIINGNKIKQVKFTKFLGIYIDEHLSWKIHINNLSQKMARNVRMLNKLKYFLPLYTMKTLCYSLILPHLHLSCCGQIHTQFIKKNKDITEESNKDNYEITIYITYRPIIFKIKTVKVK